MYKDFNHIKNVSEDGSSATMLLNKRIGNAYDASGNCVEYGIQGDQFANEMLYLKAVCQVNTIEVEINSVGGDVTNDGYNIVAAIIKHKANTTVTGLAASMAGLCAIAGEKRSIVDYGSIMCHPVAGGDGDDKILSIIQDSLKTLYINRTRMSAETVDGLFSKETWYSNSKKADYSLQDAVDCGIVDEIISSGKNLKALNGASRNVYALSNLYNNLNPTRMINLKKVLNVKNDLSDEKTEQVAIDTIETLKSEKLAAEKLVANLEAKLDAYEREKEKEKNAHATLAVENALKAGKFKTDEKADMLVLAKTNLTAFNKLVASAPSYKESVKIPFGGGVENAAEDRNNWTAVDWSKKDPEGLRNKLRENPDFYNTLKK
jgi:ATP-dependent protease ClpP protease subunit